MKLMRVERNAFAASFTSSDDETSVRTTSVSMPVCSSTTRSPSAASNAPTRSGPACRKSATALPSARNSGFATYPTFVRPRASRRSRTRMPVPTGTVLFITTSGRPGIVAGSSSTTAQTAERSASPEYVGGVPTAT